MGAQNDYGSVDAPDLSTQFEKSAASVRHIIKRVDQKYVGPGRETAFHYFNTNPISSTFAVVFFSLSILPIVSFVILSTFMTASVFILALGVALTISVSVILFLGGLMILSVFVAFLSSFLITFLVLLAWVSSNFILQRKQFPRGLSELTRETRALFGADENGGHPVSGDVKKEEDDVEHDGLDDSRGAMYLPPHDAPQAAVNGNGPEPSIKEEAKQEQSE